MELVSFPIVPMDKPLNNKPLKLPCGHMLMTYVNDMYEVKTRQYIISTA